MQRIDKSLVGTTIDGCFLLTGFIGEGGMGTTFRGSQIDLSRDVCLKFLKLDSVSSIENIERFKREARVLARLKHRNIIACYSFGVFENVYPYLALEFAEGGSLKSLLKDGPLDWRRASHLASQICDALSYAHRQGFVHRDIKPENVIVTPENDVIKVVDFGLVGKQPGQSSGFDTLTTPGSLIGTVNYMAPELFCEERRDQAVDVYAVGCTLYEMLSGRLPFDSENSIAVMNKHQKEALPELPESIRPTSVRRKLEDVIWTATAKRPTDRFSDCIEMSLALEELLRIHRTDEHVSDEGGTTNSARANNAFLRKEVHPAVGILVLCLLVAGICLVLSLCERGVVFGDRPILNQSNENPFLYKELSRESLQPAVTQFKSLLRDSEALAVRYTNLGGVRDDALSSDSVAFIKSLSEFLYTQGFNLSAAKNSQVLSIVKILSKNLCTISGSIDSNIDRQLFEGVLDTHCDLLSCFGFLEASKRIIDDGRPLSSSAALSLSTLEQSRRFYDDNMAKILVFAQSRNRSQLEKRLARLCPAVMYYLSIGGEPLGLTSYINILSGCGVLDCWRPSIAALIAGRLDCKSQTSLSVIVSLATFENRINKNLALQLLRLPDRELYLSASAGKVAEEFAACFAEAGDIAVALKLLEDIRSRCSKRDDYCWKWSRVTVSIIELQLSANELAKAQSEFATLSMSPEWRFIQRSATEDRSSVLTALLAKAGSLALACGQPAESVSLLKRAMRLIDAGLKDDPNCEVQLASSLWENGQQTEALEFVKQRIERIRNVSPEQLTDRLSTWARWYARFQLVDLAVSTNARAMKHCKPQQRAELELATAAMHEVCGRWRLALATASRVLSSAEQNRNPSVRREALLRVANECKSLGRVAQARRFSKDWFDLVLSQDKLSKAEVSQIPALLSILSRSSLTNEDRAVSSKFLARKQQLIKDPETNAYFEAALARIAFGAEDPQELSSLRRLWMKFEHFPQVEVTCRLDLLLADRYYGNFSECEKVLGAMLGHLVGTKSEIESVRSVVLQQQAAIAVMNRQPREASRLLEEALRLTPRHNVASFCLVESKLVQACIADGQLDRASLLLKDGPVVNTSPQPEFRNLARLLDESSKGAVEYARGSKDAILHLKMAQNCAREMPDGAWPLYASFICDQFASAARSEKSAELAISYVNDGLDLAKKILDPACMRHRLMAQAHLYEALAAVHQRGGKLPEAQRALERAVSSSPPGERITYLTRLAEVQNEQDDSVAAEKTFRQAMELAEKMEDPNHMINRRMVGTMYLAYGNMLMKEKSLVQARELFQKASSQFENSENSLDKESLSQCSAKLRAWQLP